MSLFQFEDYKNNEKDHITYINNLMINKLLNCKDNEKSNIMFGSIEKQNIMTNVNLVDDVSRIKKEIDIKDVIVGNKTT